MNYNSTGTIDSGSHASDLGHTADRTSSFSISPSSEDVSEAGFFLMSPATMNTLENVLHVGILPVLVLTGVPLNVINMAVFIRQGLSDRINLCLFSLTVCDTGYMIFVLVRRMYKMLNFFSDTLGEYWKVRSVQLISIYMGFFNTSNFLTLLISLERCFCVVWPLKAKTILSLRKLKVFIFLAAAICFANSLLFAFNYDLESYRDVITNVTRYRVIATDFYRRNKHVVDVIYENVNMTIPAVSLLIVTSNTVIISVRLRAALAWRQETSGTEVVSQPSSSKERRETSVTRMLVVICGVYSVCTLSFVTLALLRFVIPGFRVDGRYKNSLHAMSTIMHTFLCFNSAVNFLVYYTMSTRFKETLWDLLK